MGHKDARETAFILVRQCQGRFFISRLMKRLVLACSTRGSIFRWYESFRIVAVIGKVFCKEDFSRARIELEHARSAPR